MILFVKIKLYFNSIMSKLFLGQAITINGTTVDFKSSTLNYNDATFGATTITNKAYV